MRSFLAALLFAAIAAPCAFALSPSDIAGTWSGTVTEKQPNGIVTKLPFAIKITVPGGGGNGVNIQIRSHNAYGNDFRAIYRLSSFADVVTKVDGHVYNQGSGDWTVSSTSMRVRATLTYYDGTVFHQTTTFTFRGDRLSFLNTNNAGLRQTGKLKR